MGIKGTVRSEVSVEYTSALISAHQRSSGVINTHQVHSVSNPRRGHQGSVKGNQGRSHLHAGEYEDKHEKEGDNPERRDLGKDADEGGHDAVEPFPRLH